MTKKKKTLKVELTEKEWELVLFNLGPNDYTMKVYCKISKQTEIFT